MSAERRTHRSRRRRGGPFRWPIGWPASCNGSTRRRPYRGRGPGVHSPAAGPGYRWTARPCRKRSKRALQRAGVRQVRFHDLRHTFGTMMASNPTGPCARCKAGSATPIQRLRRSMHTSRQAITRPIGSRKHSQWPQLMRPALLRRSRLPSHDRAALWRGRAGRQGRAFGPALHVLSDGAPLTARPPARCSAQVVAGEGLARGEVAGSADRPGLRAARAQPTIRRHHCSSGGPFTTLEAFRRIPTIRRWRQRPLSCPNALARSSAV